MKIIPFIEALESAKWDEGFEAFEMGSAAYAAPPTRAWLNAVVSWVRAIWLMILCDRLGHHWECTAFSAEDGYEHIECVRCGQPHDCWH